MRYETLSPPTLPSSPPPHLASPPISLGQRLFLDILLYYAGKLSLANDRQLTFLSAYVRLDGVECILSETPSMRNFLTQRLWEENRPQNMDIMLR